CILLLFGLSKFQRYHSKKMMTIIIIVLSQLFGIGFKNIVSPEVETRTLVLVRIYGGIVCLLT
ncbi:hypothetical protein PJP10_32625, partial [Mycobacterium kansasii]